MQNKVGGEPNHMCLPKKHVKILQKQRKRKNTEKILSKINAEIR